MFFSSRVVFSFIFPDDAYNSGHVNNTPMDTFSIGAIHTYNFRKLKS